MGSIQVGSVGGVWLCLFHSISILLPSTRRNNMEAYRLFQCGPNRRVHEFKLVCFFRHIWDKYLLVIQLKIIHNWLFDYPQFILRNTSEVCEHNGEYAPGPECRFFPTDEENTATSSLMHFTSLTSIIDFCDDTNHNKESPNKQNTFCRQESVWKTIQSTSEFNTGEELVDEIPPPLKKSITKTTTNPLFYLLLDGGLSSVCRLS